MKTRTCTLATFLVAGLASSALAQSPVVVNPGFEIPRTNNEFRIASWNTFALSQIDSTRRRRVGDNAVGPVTVDGLVRSGIASGEIIPNNRTFVGVSTDFFNPAIEGYNNPIYTLGCGDAIYSYWYAIPADFPLSLQQLGIKIEFKRPNLSTYDQFENFYFGPNTDIGFGAGHTNSQWQQISMRISQADWEWLFNFYNVDNPGQPWPEPPNAASLLAFRFGGLNGGDETNTTFIDDVSYQQDTTGAATPEVELWDDKLVVATALNQAGVTEPGVPVFVTNLPYNPTPIRYGFGCVPRTGTFTAINIYDRVPDQGAAPQTFADLIANGYVRSSVQQLDGTSSAFGTSVVTQPGYRAAAQSLVVVPTMTRADFKATFTVPADRDTMAMPVVLGTPERADPVTVQSTGNYGAAATLVSSRTYPDPLIGSSQVDLTYTWTATQNITLEGGATGRGFDAFRLVWLSSMLADIGAGEYDGRFLEVESPAGVKRTLALDDAPRGVHLFTSPQATAVGRSFTLYQDNSATFNPGSPTTKVEILSVTVGGNPVGSIGVQGFLASSTDPNDDSLSIWLEWVDAPATINSGTQIVATFRVTSTDPTDVGDVDHNGTVDCNDLVALVALCDATEATANFNAYADMNGDGTIDGADFTLLSTITGTCGQEPCSAAPPCLGDADGSGVVNFSDITSVLANFGNNYLPGTGLGDADLSGIVNFSDITSVLANFGTTCN